MNAPKRQLRRNFGRGTGGVGGVGGVGAAGPGRPGVLTMRCSAAAVAERARSLAEPLPVLG